MSFGELNRAPSVAVDDGRPRTVALVAGDAAQAVLAGEDRAVVVERVAVGEIGRLEQDAVAIGVGPAADRVAADVAPQDGILVGHVDGALRPDRAAGVWGDRCRFGDQALESRVGHDPRDPLRHAEARRHRATPGSPAVATADIIGPSASRCSDRCRPRSSAVLSSTRIEHGERRGAGEGDGHPAEEDRQVEDDQPPVRRGHLPAHARSQVLASSDVVQPVRRVVADEQPDEHEEDGPRIRGQAGALVAECLELRQGQDEDAVDEPEDPVVDAEERDQDQLWVGQAGDRLAVVEGGGAAGRFGAGRARHLQDVEDADDAVLQPVDGQDRPDVPAQEQDAEQRDHVRHDQRDDGADRRTDPIPGDEALHRADASRSDRPWSR